MWTKKDYGSSASWFSFVHVNCMNLLRNIRMKYILRVPSHCLMHGPKYSVHVLSSPIILQLMICSFPCFVAFIATCFPRLVLPICFVPSLMHVLLSMHRNFSSFAYYQQLFFYLSWALTCIEPLHTSLPPPQCFVLCCCLWASLSLCLSFHQHCQFIRGFLIVPSISSRIEIAKRFISFPAAALSYD